MLVAKSFQHEPVNYSVRTLQQRRGKVSVCAGGNESHGNMLSEGSTNSTNCSWHLIGRKSLL